jgi:hypothetical protein
VGFCGPDGSKPADADLFFPGGMLRELMNSVLD